MTATERFLKYVSYSTASDYDSDTSPSTQRQKELGYALMAEMKEMGLADVHMDNCGNVIGTLPANCGADAPVLGLIAHMDTSPDASGENVKASIVNYQGGELKLSDTVSLSEALCPGLEDYVGKDIIVTDGTTLLGADDKAGIAEIMTALETMMSNRLPHGEIRAVFTTDEEVGKGTDGLDVAELGCDFAYTVDGGPIGEIEYENFNAANAVVSIKGVGVHPGRAKGVMVNATTVAMEFNALLPPDEVCEKTEGYEGFFHLHTMMGGTVETDLHYLIRDHDMAAFERRKTQMREAAEEINRRYGPGTATAVIRDSYYNMKEKILPHMHLISRAEEAFRANGIAPMIIPIRGGTDGARLSWDGLPCPNISTGGYNFHGVREWIPVSSLEKMTGVIVSLAQSFAK